MALFGGGEGGASPRTKKQKPAEIIESCVCVCVCVIVWVTVCVLLCVRARA